MYTVRSTAPVRAVHGAAATPRVVSRSIAARRQAQSPYADFQSVLAHPIRQQYSNSRIVNVKAEAGITKVLAANRGEIAVRIFRAAKELGCQTVAVYSPADRLFPHRFRADESYQIGDKDSSPVGCYLDIEFLIKIAKEHQVDAIHPGYGFLSENAQLSRRCQEEGIKFVGPPPEVLERLGDKTAARKLAIEAGVAVVPGTSEPVPDVEAAQAFAREAGYPVMLKAAMGGGGRGMRVVKRCGLFCP